MSDKILRGYMIKRGLTLVCDLMQYIQGKLLQKNYLTQIVTSINFAVTYSQLLR